MSLRQKLRDFFSRKEAAITGGGPKAIEKQVALGKLPARERIQYLLDADTFHEYDLFVEHRCHDFGMDKKLLPADGVISGTGKISGHPVCIFAQDFTVAGGSLGLMHAPEAVSVFPT